MQERQRLTREGQRRSSIPIIEWEEANTKLEEATRKYENALERYEEFKTLASGLDSVETSKTSDSINEACANVAEVISQTPDAHAKGAAVSREDTAMHNNTNAQIQMDVFQDEQVPTMGNTQPEVYHIYAV